mmetsp:Transcript_61317/g.85304  ORF Transcript_61317/g.85304 Transcript_61317/m.85304 type:complete len:89 (+) Transcript_61317:78-344(+)
MKRTKETYFRYHPQAGDREGMSGLKDFDGEDLDNESRNKFYKSKQNEWLEQHAQQVEDQKNREKEEENLYAQQTKETTRMRQMLEDDF